MSKIYCSRDDCYEDCEANMLNIDDDYIGNFQVVDQYGPGCKLYCKESEGKGDNESSISVEISM